MKPRRVLIIKPSSLGDVVHTLPVAHALKRGLGCEIGWVVDRAFQSLLAADSAIDHIYPMHIPATSAPGAGKSVYWQAFCALATTMRGLGQELTASPYDAVLDLQASFRSGLLSMMNPGGKRFGFADARELNGLFQHERIAVPIGMEHAVDKNCLFAGALGAPVEDRDFFLATSPEAEDAARAFLRKEGVKGRFVYAQPAARWASKEWLPMRWRELAEKLAGQGLPCVFGGGPGDLPLLERITAGMHAPAHIAAGTLQLLAGAALIRESACYVGVDTGPMHIAAMAGVPVVALFGPTHPERVGPYHTKNIVLQAEGLSCLRCRKRVCAELHCMDGITVERVLGAVAEILK